MVKFSKSILITVVIYQVIFHELVRRFVSFVFVFGAKYDFSILDSTPNERLLTRDRAKTSLNSQNLQFEMNLITF